MHGPKPPKPDSKDVHIPSTLRQRLEEETAGPAMRYRVKTIIAVKDSGLPIFHLELEKDQPDADTANLLSGLTSALWMYASTATSQDIQEISLEDDKVVFLEEKETETIIGVIAERTTPSAVLRTIAQEVCDLLVDQYYEMLKFSQVQTDDTK